MAIPKGKERITITIHKETSKLLESLLSLHDNNFTKSNLIEIAILMYSKACLSKLDELKEKEEA